MIMNQVDKILVMLSATCMLWLVRVALQVAYPQGSLFPVLQYGMLSIFVLITLCYLVPLMSMVFPKIPV
jgi:hypothetical protein